MAAPTNLSFREKRIHDLANIVITKLKKTEVLALRGAKWELMYDFAKTAWLAWNSSDGARAVGGERSPFGISWPPVS